MTYVNVTIQTEQERNEGLYVHMRSAEIAYWQKRAELLQHTLDNIFDHARQYGEIWLRRGGEEIRLDKRISQTKEGQQAMTGATVSDSQSP